MLRRFAPAGLTLAVALLTVAPARATVLLYMTTGQLATQASLVLQGQVLHLQVVEHDDKLWTDVYIGADDVLKGGALPGQIVALRQMGGETATEGLRVAGTARFRLGERVLVFAEAAGAGRLRPVGMCLGKYSVRPDDKGVIRAHRQANEAGIARFDAQGHMTITPGLPHETPPALADLKAAVRAALRAPLKQSRGGAR